MIATATAYGMDRALRTQVYGSVSLQEALAIFDERLANMREFYEWIEDALSDTMFGFSRSDNNFIELCIHAKDHVACSVELPSLRPSWLARLAGDRGRYETDLKTRSEVVVMLRDFFTLSEATFAESLRVRMRTCRAQ